MSFLPFWVLPLHNDYLGSACFGFYFSKSLQIEIAETKQFFSFFISDSVTAILLDAPVRTLPYQLSLVTVVKSDSDF